MEGKKCVGAGRILNVMMLMRARTLERKKERDG